MPRSGTGEYTTPLGVLAVPGFTIESAKYNLNINDVANDLNAARPIVAGGTGASNVNEALVNLKGERGYQIIQNYDSDRFHPGSFTSAADALGAPIAGHKFAGICYTLDTPPSPSSAPPPNTNIGVEARDFDDNAQPPKKYIRVKKAGVWGAWFIETFASGGSTVDPSKVLKSGDTMTGPLILSGDPTSAFQAATKSYVDTKVAAGGSGATGGTAPPPASTEVPRIEAGLGAVGVSLAYARADHVHPAATGSGQPSAGTNTPLVESGSGNAGISARYSREDHVHPALAGGANDPTKVPLNGSVPMSGGLRIAATSGSSALVLDSASAGGTRFVIGTQNQSSRWIMEIGDGTSQTGGNNGCDFAIARYSDGGGFLSYPFVIKRSTGNSAFNGDLYALGPVFLVTGSAMKPGGGPFADSSDERTKTVIDYYPDGLGKIKALEPVRYTFKGNDVPLALTPSTPPGQPDPRSPHYKDAVAGTVFTGLIAQEVETVMPEMVKQVSGYIDGVIVNDVRTLDTTQLIFCLINAIKEMAARIESLEAAATTTSAKP
jgi:hypothetical protein